MEEQFSAGVVVYTSNEQGERLYLLLHYVQGHWDFPKGHLEPGETTMQAAVRELKEETGLTAQFHAGFTETITYWLEFNGVKIHKTVTFYVGRANAGAVRLSHEHVDYAWLSLPEATQKLTYNNAKRVLALADAFLG